METKLGFRHKFAYSFFDFSAYKDFLKQGLGRSILYIFLVTLIFSTLTNFKDVALITSEISTMQNNLVETAPDFELKDGLLTVDSKETIYYKHTGDLLFDFVSEYASIFNKMTLLNSDTGDTSESIGLEDAGTDEEDDKPNYYMIIVDTTGKTNSSVLANYKDGIFIDSNGFFVKKNYRTIGNASFSDFNSLYVNNEVFLSELSGLNIILPITIMLFKPIFNFCDNLIIVFLFFGPLTLLLGSLMKVRLNYSRSCTLSFYAMTLPLLLQSLLLIAGIYVDYFSVIFYMVTLLYCGLAINELKDTNKSNLNLMK
ncbi:hypothetical protein CDLVIII_3475 [Clostridium sp. DL-VIII]|uniref:DUF1189 domain-containing protein n=1 Tax=Clostridium sp. DL-VIII TaxID=641107 RepID=UPI00023AFA93|nr:DUF1189 domain-containing protein [Clostridium sp. DL-VIII]EHJ00036.1 hypothetical protein CDLVIII_3475 [Clostridium sp. DL-VIII]